MLRSSQNENNNKKNPTAMEETLCLINHGCKLARKLQTNLPNLANQPNLLTDSCEEIFKVFSTAKERLSSQNLTSYNQLIFRQETAEHLAQAVSHCNTRNLAGKAPLVGNELPESKMQFQESASSGEWERDLGMEWDYLRTQEEQVVVQQTSGGDFPVTEVSDRGKAPATPVVHRTRTRKNGSEKCVTRVAAPKELHTELPPDDGFTWRKYGQKWILGSTFPRCYYRCAHKNINGCDATKRVQRLDEDPYTYEVTYCGQHTCLTRLPTQVEAIVDTKQEEHEAIELPSAPEDFGCWSAEDFDFGGSERGSGKELDFAFAELADAIFNSGSSNCNVMDAIFS